MDKHNFRQIFRNQRKNISLQQFRDWNDTLSQHVLDFFHQKYGNTKPLIAAYRGRNREADAWPAFQTLSEKGYRFCFPRVLRDKERSMEFCEAVPMSAEVFEKGSFGIFEPNTNCNIVTVEDMDCIIVPILAFDESGARMGHGKGFYDEMLAGFRRPKIGLAHEWQCSETSIPMEDHDVRLDYVITEKGIRKLSQE